MGISALLASQILDASATGRSVLTGADASAIRSTLGLGTLATQSATITDYLTIASAASTYQPLDSDLTSIAALSTTAFGRGLLTEASATTARSTLGLGTLATQSPTGTPSASTFLRGDYSWQTIDLSGYVPYSGATGAVNLGANAFTASRATLATGTITASTPAIDISQTWNNAAVAFTGMIFNVVDTASTLNTSYLAEFQTSSNPRFRFAKTGQFVNGQIEQGNYFSIGQNGLAYRSSSSNKLQISNAPVQLQLAVDVPLAWYSGANIDSGPTLDLILLRDASDTLAQRRSTNSQTFRIYNTFTDASNYERAKIAWESNVLRIGTEKAGTGSARALELQTDGTTRLTIASTGAVAATGRITALDFLTTSDGRGFQVWQSAGGPAAIQFGMSVPGTGSGADMWFSTTSNLNTWIGRLSISSSTGTATFYGDVQIADAKNIVINTTTGTKIGTGTTQKLGFWNATPVVQPTAVADATDAASVITQLNALLSRMRDLGLIAT